MKKNSIQLPFITLMLFAWVVLHITLADSRQLDNTGSLPVPEAPGIAIGHPACPHDMMGPCPDSEFDLMVYFLECWCIYAACFCHEMIQDYSDEGGSDLPKDKAKSLVQADPGPESRYDPLIIQAAVQYKVDPAMVKAIIMAESSFNPKAVSKWGAKGLMQLMPITAREVGVEDCFNPEHNIKGGVKYFSKLMNRFDGDVKLALAAYNAGSRKVIKFRGVPPYKETVNYIKKVIKYYKQYQDQMEQPIESA